MKRRHFLRGAGVTMGLPWLESLPFAAATQGADQPPTRTLVTYSSTADITSAAVSDRAARYGGRR